MCRPIYHTAEEGTVVGVHARRSHAAIGNRFSKAGLGINVLDGRPLTTIPQLPRSMGAGPMTPVLDNEAADRLTRVQNGPGRVRFSSIAALQSSERCRRAVKTEDNHFFSLWLPSEAMSSVTPRANQAFLPSIFKRRDAVGYVRLTCSMRCKSDSMRDEISEADEGVRGASKTV
jgi:hypothetical protein